MIHKLKWPLFSLFCFLAVFIILLFITEEQNMNYLKELNSQNTSFNLMYKISDNMFSYNRSKIFVYSLNLVLDYLIPIIFIFSGLSNFLYSKIKNIKGGYLIHCLIMFICFSIFTFAITTPINFVTDFLRKHYYGLSNQSFINWLEESIKDSFIFTFMSSFVVIISFFIIKKFKKTWWLILGALSIPYLAYITFITPLFIEPLFNKIEPLKDKHLEQAIYEQISNTTVGKCDVFQVDKSTQTKEMNAYMTGILNSKRIVLWDTTIQNMNTEEILSVTAHELGHYILGHIPQSILLGGVFSIFILLFAKFIIEYLIKKYGSILAINNIHDAKAIPLILIVLNLLTFVSLPLENMYSRYIERQADTFELELTKNNEASISCFNKLYEGNLSLPQPGALNWFWNYSHPSYKERVDFASHYKPWLENKPLKYSKFFKNSK